MTIISGSVWAVLGDGLPLPPVRANATRQDQRDQEHARIFLTEIQLRYPAGAPEDLVDASIAAINRHQTITGVLVRQQITSVERQLNLQITEPALPPLDNPVPIFLERLAARRGAYNWTKGPSTAFTAWVHGPSPLEYPLRITAAINCWEAVLVAAAESGLISLGTVRGAYISQDAPIGDLANRVLYVLCRTGATPFDHDGNAAGANAINAGDVVLIENDIGDALHHVVAVTAADHADYSRVQVMSLWNGVSGGLFGQVPLGSLLPERTRFWYASL